MLGITCEISANIWSIWGPLGPNLDGFCANNTIKTKIRIFTLRKLPKTKCANSLAQEASNLGPKRGRITVEFHIYSLGFLELLPGQPL